jgi:hypothetical protein
MKRWLIPVIVVIVVAVGVGGFFGGRAWGGGTPSPQAALKVLTNLTPAERQSLLGSGGGLGSILGNRRSTSGTGTGGFTSGSIVTSDSNSITIKLSSGGSKIVFYSPSTIMAVSKAGSASDLTQGQDVTVTGSTNSDGSITATRIQVGTLPGRTTDTGGAAAGAAGAGSTTSTT